MVEVDSPPTRNGRRIDRTFTNWQTMSASCLPPLESLEIDGEKTTSDHDIQYIEGCFDGFEKKMWHKITFKPYNAEAAKKFKSEIQSTSWHEVY